MARARVYLVGIVALAMIFLVAIRPDAYPAERELVLAAAPVPASFPRVLTSCPAVEAREEYEKGDCLQAVRVALLAGEIDLATALEELRACAIAREDLRPIGERRLAADGERLLGRLAFGDTPTPAEARSLTELGETFDVKRVPPPAAVRRLAAAGISSDGFADGRGPEILLALRTDSALREDFRTVFGDVRADDLDGLLASEIPDGTAAVTIGATTIIPNRPAVYATAEGVLALESPPDEEEPGGAVTVSTLAYQTRLLADLVAVESARQRYLESASRLYQHAGSVRVFLSSVRTFRGESEPHAELRATAERDRAILAARLANLDRRMGADPLLYRMAGESVGIATEINERCRSVAESRRRWIRTGAGMVTGLVGAAGLVVATGATGTLVGGVTIAAALEASVGAYLIAASERIGVPATTEDAPRPAEELQTPESPADREDRFDPVFDGGDDGDGGLEAELTYDDFGEPRELGLVVGEEGDEVDRAPDGESTESTPRENSVPPILPDAIPEALRELPPLLDDAQIRALRELTLPEIQERLDDFLAGPDSSNWANLAREEEVAPWSSERMLDEAEAALELWEHRRELATTFGAFFIQAETENLPGAKRPEALTRAMGRYLGDRGLYADSRDVDDLRQRVASRLVTHCRAGAAIGDLALVACADETALSVLLVAALRDAGVDVPAGSVLGVQVFGPRFEAVLYSRERNRVFSLTRGGEMEGVVAPIYHPATFYYTYLLAHDVIPEIDLDQHLLVALPDRPMPVAMAEVEACTEQEDRPGFISRAVGWLASLVGVRRIEVNECDPDAIEQARTARHGGGGNIDLSIPSPLRNPLQGGSGQSGGGGGQGGAGGGGGNPLDRNEPGDPMSSGGSGSGEGSGGGGENGSGAAGGQGGEGTEAGGSGAGGEGESGAGGGGSSGETPGDAPGNAAATADETGGEGAGGGSSGAPGGGSGDGEGGYAIAGAAIPDGPNLTRIGRETVRAAERYSEAPALGVMPWRLRDDEGMLTGSTTRVLWADNARALERFGEDDLFITLAPAEVEAQRRMLEADAFPILGSDMTCETAPLPPLRVFRRAAPGDPGYRYVFCDHDESMVIFRTRDDADSYSRLSAPDRPLFLARLASERLARFERSPEIARLREFLADPNVVRSWSQDETRKTVAAAADLVVFQNALESALVQSMNELGPSEVRSYYYEMHRQVIQAPFFLDIAEDAYLLNKRLASDPLQSLAWANVQETSPRRGFFDLYFTIGSFMEWPDRWATLKERYGSGEGASPAATDAGAPSLDFLQILSDPTRVRVDWTAERTGTPSIRDRQTQDGVERTHEEARTVTTATERDRETEIEHLRAGTDGLGRSGEGESGGPESGRRPLQMVRIRVVPDIGEPENVLEHPEENRTPPGGTRGRERRNTEESASRQEPILWVSPTTFVEAVLSNWDSRDLHPETAGRVPPVLRFNERLRQVYLRELRPAGIYDNRLRAAMEIFTRADWLRYQEVRDAMGGPLASVKAFDMGRFSGAYSGNAPINDQDQIRIPNFFRQEGVVIPGDLFNPVREHYTRSVLGIFDLESLAGIPPAWRLSAVPLSGTESSAASRAELLRSLETIGRQASEDN